jgi:hypothetical protein
MFRIFFLAAVFFLISLNAFSQSSLKVLQKQLPETVQSNPELLKQITSTLQRDLQLNPDLLAYRIRYYQKLFDEGIQDNDLNGLNNLRLLTAYFYQERNFWLKNEKQIVTRSKYLDSYKQNALNILDSYFRRITEDLGPAKMDIDKNLVDFYAAIALGAENLGNYDSSLDYSNYRAGYNAVIINSFVEKKELLKKGFSIDEPIEKVMEYWYLFPNDNGEDKFSPGSYFMEYFGSKYSVVDFSRIGLYVGSSFFHLKETINVNSQDSFISSEPLLGEVSNSTLINIAASYRFLLAENIGPASFFTIAISAGLSLDPNQSKNDSLIVYKREPLPNNGFISDTWDVDVLDITDISRTSLSLKVAMPVLFFNKDLFVEIGFISGYNFATYTIKYQYQYTKTKVEWDPNFQRFFSSNLDRQISGPLSESYSSSKFIFYPNIDLTIQNYKPLVLQVSLGYNYTSLNVGFTF